MCTFRASCCNARLSQAKVLAFTGSSVRNWEKKEGEGVRGDHLHWRGYKGGQAVLLGSVAGGGFFEVLWNLECPV